MKKGHYTVRPTSKAGRIELVDYLEKNGLRYEHGAMRESTIESRFPLVVDLGERYFYPIETVSPDARVLTCSIPL